MPVTPPSRAGRIRVGDSMLVYKHSRGWQFGSIVSIDRSRQLADVEFPGFGLSRDHAIAAMRYPTSAETPYA